MDYLFIALAVMSLWYFIKKAVPTPPKDVENIDLPISQQGPTRANRNNNPGNLKYMGQAGAIGKDDAGFAVFATLTAGWQALYRQIELDKKRNLTIDGFISKYAPSSDGNDTDAYINYMVDKLNALTRHAPLQNFETEHIALYIAKMEGFA